MSSTFILYLLAHLSVRPRRRPHLIIFTPDSLLVENEAAQEINRRINNESMNK